MNKFLISLPAVVLFAAYAFADLNTRIGAGIFNSLSFSSEYGSNSSDADVDFNTSVEYLFRINDMFRVGPGMEIALGTKLKNARVQATNIPFYISLECHPFKETEGIFFRGNIGYTFFSLDEYIGNESITVDSEYKSKGGIYYALGAGYSFKFGLMVDLTYGFYHGSFREYDIYTERQLYPEIDAVVKRLALNVGYKFKI